MYSNSKHALSQQNTECIMPPLISLILPYWEHRCKGLNNSSLMFSVIQNAQQGYT